jgi:hypothetical protein
LQTQPTLSQKRSAAAKARWAKASDEEKRAHASKMLEARWAEPKAANRNGQATRTELASAFEALDRMDDEAALQAAKRALSGNGLAKPIALVDAVIVVQDALESGELELVAEDGKARFYIPRRRRLSPGEVEAVTEDDGRTAYYLVTRERVA